MSILIFFTKWTFDEITVKTVPHKKSVISVQSPQSVIQTKRPHEGKKGPYISHHSICYTIEFR